MRPGAAAGRFMGLSALYVPLFPYGSDLNRTDIFQMSVVNLIKQEILDFYSVIDDLVLQ